MMTNTTYANSILPIALAFYASLGCSLIHGEPGAGPKEIFHKEQTPADSLPHVSFHLAEENLEYGRREVRARVSANFRSFQVGHDCDGTSSLLLQFERALRLEELSATGLCIKTTSTEDAEQLLRALQSYGPFLALYVHWRSVSTSHDAPSLNRSNVVEASAEQIFFTSSLPGITDQDVPLSMLESIPPKNISRD